MKNVEQFCTVASTQVWTGSVSQNVLLESGCVLTRPHSPVSRVEVATNLYVCARPSVLIDDEGMERCHYIMRLISDE